MSATTAKITKSRRISSRVAEAFAFGTRLPLEITLLKDFTLSRDQSIQSGADEEGWAALCQERDYAVVTKKRRGEVQYYVPRVVKLKPPPLWTAPTVYQSLLENHKEESLVIALKGRSKKMRVNKGHDDKYKGEGTEIETIAKKRKKRRAKRESSDDDDKSVGGAEWMEVK